MYLNIQESALARLSKQQKLFTTMLNFCYHLDFQDAKRKYKENSQNSLGHFRYRKKPHKIIFFLLLTAYFYWIFYLV